MYITEESHTIIYDNPSMPSGVIEVDILWSDGFDALIPNKAYDGEFWIEFKDGAGRFHGFRKDFYYLCTPSVRREVERAFKEFLRYCGIRAGSVIKESQVFHMNVDGAEYIVNFEGIPGSGTVRCSVEKDGRVVHMGMADIEIICEKELLKCACSTVRRRK